MIFEFLFGGFRDGYGYFIGGRGVGSGGLGGKLGGTGWIGGIGLRGGGGYFGFSGIIIGIEYSLLKFFGKIEYNSWVVVYIIGLRKLFLFLKEIFE